MTHDIKYILPDLRPLFQKDRRKTLPSNRQNRSFLLVFFAYFGKKLLCLAQKLHFLRHFFLKKSPPFPVRLTPPTSGHKVLKREMILDLFWAINHSMTLMGKTTFHLAFMYLSRKTFASVFPIGFPPITSMFIFLLAKSRYRTSKNCGCCCCYCCCC